MCGITGWVDFRKDLQHEQEILNTMTETLGKRGPDDTNLWFTPHAAFGHKRLVVVDPLCGIQPMTRTKEEYTYTICYNGELYNTEDLRTELLKRGYTYQGHSDTEVLLTAYIEWGEQCVDHLNGIFAFAIWDGKKEQLFVGRDRLGVKPFFFKEHDGGLLFGSEIKAILAHPTVKTEVTYDGLAEVWGLGPSRTPGTGVFRGIQELRPAHAMIFSRNGVKIWRYWNVKSKKHTDSVEETADHIRSLFQDTVVRQLVSDVPVCTFLSGGVDSSAITAIAANYFKAEGKGPLHTFSIDYEENDRYFKANDFQPNADGPWIQKMAESFQTVHHSCVITQEDLAEYLKEAVIVRDVPGMADVDSSLLWFCKQIKKDFVVSLSGECADEIFGGYPWFRQEDDLNREGFPWMRSLDERIGLLKGKWQDRLQLKEYVMSQYESSISETPLLDGESPLEEKRRKLFYMNMLWFMTTLLDRKDRMSMGASLEVRVPFADHRLVEYVWNIPWEIKMYGNREKGILRKALEGILPEEILYRKKSPYPKTHHPAYTKAVNNWLTEILEHKDSILYEFIERDTLMELVKTNGDAFKTPWFGQLMTGPQLLAYLAQIHHWFETYRINISE